MTIQEITDRVLSLYSSGVPSDDIRLSRRLVFSKLKSARSLLLRREYDKNRSASDFDVQYLECIEMEEAQPFDCPCLDIEVCPVWKSKLPLPSILKVKSGLMITSVTSIDASLDFAPTTFSQEKYTAFNKYTSNDPRYYIKNDHLFVNKKINMLTVGAVFENPEELYTFCADDSALCLPIFAHEFPLEAALLEPAITMALDELVNIMGQIPDDRTNDAQDN